MDGGITRINLSGRLDVQGRQDIDMKFTSMTATRKAAVLIDMSEADFIASIGIRTRVSSAKALAKRGGKMVLLNPCLLSGTCSALQPSIS